jgi:hypothetical protein
VPGAPGSSIEVIFMEDEEMTDLEWLAARNQAWFDEKGEHAMYHISYYDGRMYFYTRKEDYPDIPAVWYPGESIGTWSPRSNTFMWSCDNKTTVDQSIAISKKAKAWFESNRSTPVPVLPVESLAIAWEVVAVAAKISNVIAVYNAPCTYRSVEDDLKKAGKRVPVSKKNKIYNHDFFAITGGKHVMPRS